MNAALAQLNDECRSTLRGGRIFVTQGVAELGPIFILLAVREARSFRAFTSDNDPYGTHEFGSFTVAGQKLFWKIDIFADASLAWGAADPTAPDVYQVLTVMLPLEY